MHHPASALFSRRLVALLVTAALAAALTGSAAKAATDTVCASGCPFTTIQAAVNAASTGGLDGCEGAAARAKGVRRGLRRRAGECGGQRRSHEQGNEAA